MIPKIIHHIAPDDQRLWHPIWDKCFPTWYQYYPEPEYQHMLWNDDDMIDGVVKDEFPKHYETYKNLRHIMRIDIAKMVILYVYGGLYVDMDYQCRANFFDELDKDVCLTGSIHFGEVVQNGMLAVSPRHPFIKAHIDDMINRTIATQDDGSDECVKETTGPLALGRAYDNLCDRYDIKILDANVYNPSVDIFYTQRRMKKVKCIHLLSGVWGDKDRRPKVQARQMYEEWRGIRLDDV